VADDRQTDKCVAIGGIVCARALPLKMMLDDENITVYMYYSQSGALV